MYIYNLHVSYTIVIYDAKILTFVIHFTVRQLVTLSVDI